MSKTINHPGLNEQVISRYQVWRGRAARAALKATSAMKDLVSYSFPQLFQHHGNLQQPCETIFHSEPRTPGELFVVSAKQLSLKGRINCNLKMSDTDHYWYNGKAQSSREKGCSRMDALG